MENEAQLASVLGHEIAHINLRHSIKALQQAGLAQGIAETAGINMNTLTQIGYPRSATLDRLPQIGYQVTINLPRSRDAEYEADAAGLQILQAAGYPPQAFINFLEKLESSAIAPEFLQTHPTSANRIERIREPIAERPSSS